MTTVELVDTSPTGLGPSGTVRCNTCGQEQWFINPTPERVAWYINSHRCGGEGWQS